MRKTFIVMASTALTVLLASGCGGDRNGQDPRGALPPQRGPNVNDVFARGVELHEAGDCRKAIPHLYRAASRGSGYEDAQWRLGECLMRRTKPAISSTLYLEGLVWIRRAAEAGWPEAQERLAVAYTRDDLVRPEEAAMWLALSNRNVRRSRIGFVSLAPETLADIRARLSPAQIAEGEARANAWTKSVWRPLLKSRAESEARPKGRQP